MNLYQIGRQGAKQRKTTRCRNGIILVQTVRSVPGVQHNKPRKNFNGWVGCCRYIFIPFCHHCYYHYMYYYWQCHCAHEQRCENLTTLDGTEYSLQFSVHVCICREDDYFVQSEIEWERVHNSYYWLQCWNCFTHEGSNVHSMGCWWARQAQAFMETLLPEYWR